VNLLKLHGILQMTGKFITVDCQLAQLSYTKPENNGVSPAHCTSMRPCCDIFRYNLHHYCAMTIHATLTATKFMGSKLTLPKDWCTALDMDRCVCESISNEILDLYEMGNRDVYENIADLSTLHG